MHAQQAKSAWWRRLLSPAASPRTEEVIPPSQRDDGSWVFLAAMAIVVCVIYVIAFERSGSTTKGNDQQQRGLLPYQTLFRDLPSRDQRIFRAMQEGVAEALRARGSNGTWPTVETLATQGVPPFARDPLDKSGLRWDLRNSALLYQYVGVPSVAGDTPAFMISILEPEPVTGEKPVPGVVDEEHQVLPDGSLLHITYWLRRAEGLGTASITDPSLAGWTQIRVKSPLEEAMEER